MKSRTRHIGLLIILAVLLAAGCAASQPTEQRPLKIGWQVWPGWYPALLADHLGYFESRGLKVQLIPYEILGDANIDFAAGKLDGVFQTVFDVLPVNARQNRTVSPVVLITDNTLEADSIVAIPSILNPADLKGKRLGVKLGSYAEVLVRAMLNKNGLSPADVQLTDLPPEAAAEHLGKTVDAIHTYEPYLSELVAQGNNVIFTGAETPGLLLDVLTMSDAAVKQRPAEVREFIDAFFAAQEWWANHRIEGNRVIAEATDQGPEDIKTDGIRLYRRSDNQYAFTNPSASDSLRSSLEGNLQFLLEIGALSVRPDLDKLINPDFLQRQ
jgi:NitT/TauT family transport system substrate-binding protein